MKYLIKESQIDDIIRKYLDYNYIPDWGWLEPEDYKEEFEKWGELYFEINDHTRYKYVSGNLIVGEGLDPSIVYLGHPTPIVPKYGS